MNNSSPNGVVIIAVLAAAAFALWHFFGRSVSEDEYRTATAKAVRCDAQSVCVMASDGCSDRVAVNSQQLDAYTGISRQYRRSRGCPMAGEIANPGNWYPACVANECTMVKGADPPKRSYGK